MADIKETLHNAKDKLSNIAPIPEDFHPQATPHELKSRLDWGEPALTILDTRDRSAFNERRIQGAISVPMATLQQRADSIAETRRDIYVYGGSESETSEAANLLRQLGYQRIAELKGGLDAWEAAGGSVEGTVVESTESRPLSSGSFNVASRMRDHAEEKKNEN